MKLQCRCLCQQTQFEIDILNHHVSACHCSMCRRQSSGINMSVFILENSLKWIKQNHLSIYESSEWGERGFCGRCGTSLFWRSKDHQLCNVNVFCIENDSQDINFTLETQIFIDHKPDFYRLANHTKNLTEADVIALYANEDNA